MASKHIPVRALKLQIASVSSDHWQSCRIPRSSASRYKLELIDYVLSCTVDMMK